jgi:translation initiation factor IF-1
MHAKIGDRVVVETERTSRTARQGVIEEILQEQPPRFRVQWDDGHESILTPASGALRVEKQRTKTRAR